MNFYDDEFSDSLDFIYREPDWLSHYESVGFRPRSEEETDCFRLMGVPVAGEDDEFFNAGDLMLSKVVFEDFIVTDHGNVKKITAGLCVEYDTEVQVEIDYTMYDFLDSFSSKPLFAPDASKFIVKAGNVKMKEPMVIQKTVVDKEVSALEWGLVKTGLLDIKDLLVYNPSAGTIKRLAGIPGVLFTYTNEYFASVDSQKILKRAECYKKKLVLYDKKKYIDHVHYFGFSGVKKNFYSLRRYVAFEINPYSLENKIKNVIDSVVKLLDLPGQYDPGYRIVYSRGGYQDTYDFFNEVPFYRMNCSDVSALFDSKNPVGHSFITDRYILVCTDPFFFSAVDVIPLTISNGVTFMPVDCVPSLTYDSVQERKVFFKDDDVMVSKSIKCCYNKGRLVDVLAPFSIQSRRFFMKHLFVLPEVLDTEGFLRLLYDRKESLFDGKTFLRMKNENMNKLKIKKFQLIEGFFHPDLFLKIFSFVVRLCEKKPYTNIGAPSTLDSLRFKSCFDKFESRISRDFVVMQKKTIFQVVFLGLGDAFDVDGSATFSIATVYVVRCPNRIFTIKRMFKDNPLGFFFFRFIGTRCQVYTLKELDSADFVFGQHSALVKTLSPIPLTPSFRVSDLEFLSLVLPIQSRFYAPFDLKCSLEDLFSFKFPWSIRFATHNRDDIFSPPVSDVECPFLDM